MQLGETDIEATLVKGCIAGERASQYALYSRYSKAMYTICVRILTDEDLAADALQEGFIEVFNSIEAYQYKSTLGAWIKTIITRKAILHSRRHTKHEALEEKHENEVITWQDGLTGKDLDKAIKALPVGYRNVFVLTEIEGYSHKEVSEMLNINEGTSRSQLYHAKKTLQNILNAYA